MWLPHAFAPGGTHIAARDAHASAVIDDDTPTPAHATFAWGRLAVVVTVFVALWASALGVLAAVSGLESTLAQMGWFFTKAALLTFGGAYAVLPYVIRAPWSRSDG